MNRIEEKFQSLKIQKRKAFIAFITAGDPDLKTTEDLVVAFEGAGVDIIELGIPFSDPLADGPTIQASYHRALKKGTTVKKILETVKRIRSKTSIPIALMSSYNPILRFGEERFIKACAEVGVDGLIIPDLPPEEAQTLCVIWPSMTILPLFSLWLRPARMSASRLTPKLPVVLFIMCLSQASQALKKQSPYRWLNKSIILKNLPKNRFAPGLGFQPRNRSKISAAPLMALLSALPLSKTSMNIEGDRDLQWLRSLCSFMSVHYAPYNPTA